MLSVLLQVAGALCLCSAAPVPVPPKAPTVEIAPGVHMPLTIYGSSEYRGEIGVLAAMQALNYSYVAIDTAHGYGIGDGNYDQKAVGVAIEGKPRDSLFLITKVPGGLPYNYTLVAIEQDLYALGVDQVDLLLIHHPISNPTLGYEKTLQAQWAALEMAYRMNLTRAIGVSNFCAKAMAAIEKTWTIVPAVNQVYFHAGSGPNPDGIFTVAAKHNIHIQAFSATDASSPRILHGEPYTSIGKKHNKTSMQVALRWITQHEPPVSYIAASSNPLHLVQNIDIYDFELSPAEMALIDSQRHCKNGGPQPNCLPYFPGSEGCNECCCKTFPAYSCCCPTVQIV